MADRSVQSRATSHRVDPTSARCGIQIRHGDSACELYAAALIRAVGLVVGNQTLDSPLLAAAIAERAREGPATFHVVVPATPSKGGLT